MADPVVFVSYSHQDQGALSAFLSALDATGIERDLVWSDRDIDAGERWSERIDAAIDSAQVAVVLVSPAALASAFIRDKELPPLLTATERPSGALALLCLHLSTSDASEIPVRFFHPRDGRVREALLTDFQGLNDPQHPLDTLAEPIRVEVLARAAETVARLARSRTARFDLNQTTTPVSAANDAAARLARVLARPEVRAQAVSFSDQFDAARQRIARVADLKDLHDLLHTARIRCFEPIESELATMLDPELTGEAVWEASLELVDTADAMVEWLARDAVEAADRVWITQFNKAAHRLQREVEQLADRRRLPSMRVLGQVLRTRLPAVNQRLLAAASQLPLDPLTASLDRIAASLAGVEAGGVGDLEASRARLSAVTEQLTAVSLEHDRWQQLDLQITVGGLEDMLDAEPEEAADFWDSLGMNDLVDLCCTDPNDRAHAAVRQRAELLQAALRSGDTRKAPALLRRLRTRVAVHFYKVDVHLRRVCDELRALAGPIDGLLAWLKE